MNKIDRIAKGLIASGCIELTSNSKRYRKFQRPDKDARFFWLGKRGELKTGMLVSGLFLVPRRLVEKYIRAGVRLREKEFDEAAKEVDGRLI